jgi:two-component system, NtrC family, sensor histidine kinase HydH
MDVKRKLNGPFAYLPSPWLIIGAASILALAVIVLAVINSRREERYMNRILSEKGAALIRSLEAGARTWMHRGLGRGVRLQTLIEETGKQEDILFITVTDREGRILAQSDGAGIGERFMEPEELSELAPSTTVQSRFIRRGEQGQAFEVYKEFVPLRVSSPEGMRGMGRRPVPTRPEFWRSHGEEAAQGSQGGQRTIEENPYIFIGMDPTPFLQARDQDLRNSVIITSTLVLLVLGGVTSLFWAQSARASRRELIDFQALAAKVVASLPVGLVVTDRDGRVAYVNGVAERVMGKLEFELAGKDDVQVLPPELVALTGRLSSGAAVLEDEIDLARPDGGISPVGLSGSDILTAEGQFAGRLYILRDLRDVRELQSEIRRREKLAALGSLAAGMAHEVRNPLSSIKGFATYLGGKFPKGSEEEEAAAVMIQETERLNRVISELLEFARPSDIKPKPVAIDDLIARSLKLIAPDAAHKGVGVEAEIAEGVGLITLDPDRMIQALLNVYLNAIQAMDSGGTLRVRAGEEGSLLRLDIEDTGSGIQAQDVSRVFDPYYTSKAQGTGLGLAIVHKIVEAHGGQVKVLSTPGVGTRLTFLLPRNGRGGTPQERPDHRRS